MVLTNSSFGVMQVVLTLDAGGTERLVVELARRVSTAGRSIVCCLDRVGLWGQRLQASGIPVISLGRLGGFQPHLGAAIARLATDHEIGLLHCHQYTPYVYGRLASLLRPSLRVVYTEHGRASDEGPTWKRRLINPLLSAFPGEIFAVSEELRRYMIRSGFARRRVSVVPNGVVATQRAPSPHDRLRARADLGLPPTAFVVGTAARLDAVKDLGNLVEAFATLLGEEPAARLVILGDGPERGRLEERVSLFSCEGNTVFGGYRADVQQLLPAFDVFVNCSVIEGMSLTILEAMAASLPVIATNVGGNPEVVEPLVTGVLVAPRSPNALAGALLDLWADPGRRVAMGRAGRSRCVERFGLERMVKQYFRAYGVALRA